MCVFAVLLCIVCVDLCASSWENVDFFPKKESRQHANGIPASRSRRGGKWNDFLIPRRKQHSKLVSTFIIFLFFSSVPSLSPSIRPAGQRTEPEKWWMESIKNFPPFLPRNRTMRKQASCVRPSAEEENHCRSVGRPITKFGERSSGGQKK